MTFRHNDTLKHTCEIFYFSEMLQDCAKRHCRPSCMPHCVPCEKKQAFACNFDSTSLYVASMNVSDHIIPSLANSAIEHLPTQLFMRLLPHWYQSIEDARILITDCTHRLACPCVFARMCPYLSTSLQAELIRPGMFFAGSNQIGVLFSLTCSISDVLERKEKGCLTFRT